jgi:hypothetical protein
MVTKDLPVVNNDCLRTTDIHLLANVTESFFTGNPTVYNGMSFIHVLVFNKK